ncbi:MAG: 2-octaprenyl-6-methoxyphenyl hydroxylase [Pseudomonadota bacterium]
MKTDYDIFILGGGLAGISMALSLAHIDNQQALRIAVLEKIPFDTDQPSSFDDRCIALSAGSKQIYQSMDLWDKLNHNNQPVTEPIKDILICEQGKFGFARLNYQQEKVDALGYVVESHALGKVLLEQAQQHKNIDIFCPVEIKQIDISLQSVSLQFIQKQITNKKKLSTLSASLVIAADGNQSIAHQFLEVAPSSKAYLQSAIITNIETEYPHQGQAFERFTEAGPLAILPLTKNRCSLVWTIKEKQLDQVMSLTDQDFLQQLQQHFGYRLGKIQRIGKRFAYPLILKSLDTDSAAQLQRLVFVGNAAHSIHPVTGQGFNLGLRDIQCLSELIKTNLNQHQGKFVYQQDLVKNYWHNREKDIRNVTRFTDGLIQVFSNNTFPITPIRNLSLSLFELYQPLKTLLARFAMGL